MSTESIDTAHRGPRLVLYISSLCGYCYRVLLAVKQLSLDERDIAIRNVTLAPRHRQDIVRGTGRRTVPALRILPGPHPGGESVPAPGSTHAGGPADAEEDREKWLFESRDIVRFLRTRFAHRE